MSISIGGVVVLYYPDDKVIDNIRSYQNDFDILYLIDNSDIDNSDIYGNLSPSINYVPLKKNYGIAYALNVGVKKLRNEKIQYIITMDQDSYFYHGTINNYKKHISDSHITHWLALTPQYDTDRTKLKSQYGIKKVKIAMQSGALFSVNSMEIVGFFNNDLFLDVVDWEYFLRGNLSGLFIYQCNDVILKHHPAETKEIIIFNKSIKYGIASPLRYYYQIRNLLWTFITYKDFFFLFVFFVKWAKILFLFDTKNEYIRLAKQAVSDALHSRLGEYKSY